MIWACLSENGKERITAACPRNWDYGLNQKIRGDTFHKAVFRAYFADGKNIAKVPVLLDLAESAGLPREEAASVLATRAFKAEVDADWALSREKAITAAPTFVMKQDKLVGAQPYDMLEKLMTANGIKKRG